MSGVGKNTPSIPHCLKALEGFGKRGASTEELTMTADRSQSVVTRFFKAAIEQGLIEFWPEPTRRATNRRRYYALGMRPEQPPEPIKTAKKPSGATAGAAQALAYRWHVDLPRGYVSSLDASQCRPWAEAAAR